MDNQEQRFLPESVDEQIDQLARTPSRQQSTGANLMRDLHDVYTEADEAQMLASVWERLVEHIEESEAQDQPGAKKIRPLSPKILHHGRFQDMKQTTVYPQKPAARRWSLMAAVLFAALLVGSMAWVFSLSRHPNTTSASPNGVTSKKTPQATAQPAVSALSGLYIGSQDKVSRIDVKTGTVIWQTTLKPAPNAPPAFREVIANHLIVAGDTVYVSSQDGILYAINAQNGASRWSHAFMMEMGKPFVVDGVLYISVSDTDKGYVYAFNLDNGQEVRHYQFPVSNLDPFVQATVANKELYVSNFYDLFAINLSDGKQLWHKQISQQQMLNAPQVIDGILYTSSSEVSQHSANEPQDSYVYAFNASNGEQIWQSSKMNGFVFNITVANNAIYCGAQNQHVYAYDKHDGHVLWARDIAGDSLGAPQVANGVVYFDVSNDSLSRFVGITALDAATGAVKWQKANVSSDMFANLAVANGVVYVPTFNVYALNAANGTVVWQYKLKRGVESMALVP